MGREDKEVMKVWGVLFVCQSTQQKQWNNGHSIKRESHLDAIASL